MELSIYAPDQPRTDVAVLLQASFAQIGISLDVQTLDFNALYDDNMGAQTFDMAVAGWRGGLPFDADQRGFFGAENDIPGLGTAEYGFNFGSWYHEEWESLNEYIKDGAVADGCAPEAIQEAAYRAQEIIWEEQPYLWLYAQNSAYAVNDTVNGFAPQPLFGAWNLDTWEVAE
jgi:peptide/nickel transport system substrate-binding protein